MAFEKPVVVLDNGSYNLKAGFACDNHPVSIFRTVVGRPKYLMGSYGREYYDVYIGDEALARIEDLELFSPVVEGRIAHWDNMERIWHHTFYRELKVAPEDRSVILAVNATTPLKDKFKCCEIFFETLNAPALCIQAQSVLALYGSGLSTGVAVDLGYDTASVTPVYEGLLINYAIVETKLASRQISQYIKNCLIKRNIVPTHGTVADIKKRMYVTKNVAMDRKNCKKMYKLDSGEVIDIGQEAFMSAELLFQPDLVCGEKTEYLSIHDAIVTSCLRVDQELRQMMYGAIVPCGGMATIPGLNERLLLETEKLSRNPINLVTSTEAYTVPWLGGATFAGMTESQQLWVTKKQFEDHGAKIVKVKFL